VATDAIRKLQKKIPGKGKKDNRTKEVKYEKANIVKLPSRLFWLPQILNFLFPNLLPTTAAIPSPYPMIRIRKHQIQGCSESENAIRANIRRETA
jgi:hypothetical protein